MKTAEKSLLLAFIAVFIVAATLLSVHAFTALSLSHVDFSSNDATLNKPAWVLTVTEDGNEAYAVGTIDNEAISRSDGATAANDLKLEIQNSQNTCLYNFQNSATGIYNYELHDVSWWNYNSDCDALAGTKASIRGVRGFYGFCLIKTQTATYAPLSTPATTFTSNIKATVKGETVTGTVNNLGAKSAWLGNRVYASWTGNLVNGQQCPNPLDTQVVGVKIGDNFRITNKAAYDSYAPAQSDLVGCINGVSTLSGQHDAVAACTNTYNTKSGSVLITTNKAPFTTATVSNGQANIILASMIQYPVITFRIDAAWIGIYLPVGMPSITSVSPVTFSEGGQGTAHVTVKNVGTARAGFNLGLTCTAPANAATTSQTVSLDAGQSTTVNMLVSGVAGGSVKTTSCIATATDINNPANKDSKSFSVTISPISICNTGDQRCTDGKTVEICNAGGTSWITSEVCPNGCVAGTGIYTCSEPVACTKDADCNDNDPSTEDHCVGVLSKQCKYTPVTSMDWGPYTKLGLFLAVALIFAALGIWVSPWFFIGTAFAAIGGIIGAFSIFSTAAAIFITLALILLVAGLGTVEWAPSAAIPLIAGGIICVIIAVFLAIYPPATWFGGWFI